ncbi:patatin-like phospholipase family protein [Kitasatospora kifunensis]|uniref:NTE family protein n=1 Tax=Kitasatospora kifunensis TaxID=58351 RepID=A0A7W7VY65_KITKI|nr:patatin-like phospholipase family protein [Kitasatospora kifunensis]MBB4926713.1 NTE family protein [Kitasatospora kifunensis]
MSTEAKQRALVLGGGGLAGIAWETGVLAGLAEAGVDVTGADHVIGTSAGAAVAGQLASGLPLAELFQRQADPALQNPELTPIGMTVGELLEYWGKLLAEFTDRTELRKQVGRLARDAETVSPAARREVIEGRLPVHAWPEWSLALVAVDADSGEPRLFDRASGVGLVDAVAASCAVPGIWPTVTIDGTPYMDGGIRSSNNADLAAGYRRVLVLAPMADPFLAEEVELLSRSGRVELITPDEASAAAFGTDPLDPGTRTPAAQAGLAQGRRLAEAVRALWN